MKAYLALLLVAAATLSGCLGGGGGNDPAPSDEDTYVPPVVTDTEGAIAGAVADESITPLEGAVASIEGAKSADTTTDAMGRFQFDHLAPGRYTVTILAYGYYPLEKGFDVKAGVVSDHTFLLDPLPSTDPYIDGPSHEALFMECQTGLALTTKPATPTDFATDAVADAVAPLPLLGLDGLADALIRGTDREWNETSPFGLSASACSLLEGYNNDRFSFQFEHEGPGLGDIVVEMAWSPRSGSARALSISIEPCLPAEETNSEDDEPVCYFNSGYYFARLQGASPLKAIITSEKLAEITASFNGNETVESEADPGFTNNGYPVASPQDFTMKAGFLVRVFTVSDQLGPGAPADYALSYQQPADVYISKFYNQRASLDYTGIPDQ